MNQPKNFEDLKSDIKILIDNNKFWQKIRIPFWSIVCAFGIPWYFFVAFKHLIKPFFI